MLADEQTITDKFISRHHTEEQKIILQGLATLEIEARAIQDLKKSINSTFVAACLSILKCEGRIVVAGIGKSGHIGKKIAATLASTGTPAFFLHPAEASHGDLGMITDKDVFLTLSYSGETDEILKILPLIKRLDITIIALTGAPHSTLAKYSNFHLDVGIQQEACPLGLAPTTSTTVMLAMGDAIALSVLKARGFTAEDFARSHPGGKLGRRLLLTSADVMHKNAAIPRVTEKALLAEAVLEMTNKRLGFTTVTAINDSEKLVGIFTDGDLRRAINQNFDIHNTPICKVMTKNFRTVTQDMLATEVVLLMEKIKTLVMPVIDHNQKLVGALNMHDLFKAGVV